MATSLKAVLVPLTAFLYYVSDVLHQESDLFDHEYNHLIMYYYIMFTPIHIPHTALPDNPPSISVVSRHPTPDDVCGEAMTLSCTANPVEGLFTPPIIIWIDPNGSQLPIEGINNPTVDAGTGNLVFSDVTLNNRGVYTCRAIINIPEALISNYSDQSITSINTICKLFRQVS